MSHQLSNDDPRKALFDRKLGALFGVPDVLSTAPTTIQVAEPLVGDAQTFIVQTYRGKDPAGDVIFVQYVDRDGAIRLVIPPRVADVIARQRDALTAKSRSRAAKAKAAERKAAGKLPGFMKPGAKRGGRKPKAD